MVDPSSARTYTPVAPLLRIRWVAALVMAVACVLPSHRGQVVGLAASMAWMFAVAGLLGYWRTRRWFRQSRGGTPELLRLRRLGLPRVLWPPAVAAAVVLATTAPLSWRLSLAWLAIVAAGLAGFSLAGSVALDRWQRGTGHQLLAPVSRRPWIRRSTLRAQPLAGAERLPARRRALLPLLLAGLCAIAAVSLATLDARAAKGTHVDESLSAVAGTVAGHSVHVVCWSSADWHAYQRRYRAAAGVTWHGRIYLEPHVCAWLEWLRAGHWSEDSKNQMWMAESGGVLAHESGHIALGRSERDAECFALDNVARTLELLGVEPGRADRLQSIYRYSVHPHLPAAYTQPC